MNAGQPDSRIAVGPDELKRMIAAEANAAGKSRIEPSDIALIDDPNGWTASFVKSGPALTEPHIFEALARVQAQYRPTHFRGPNDRRR